MPDREKVIKGLEICSAGEWNSTGGRDHTDCPYYPAGYTGYTCKLLMRDALTLLREQETVEPRVLTLEEVMKLRHRDEIWIEYSGAHSKLFMLTIARRRRWGFTFYRHFPCYLDNYGGKNNTNHDWWWRCWSNRPTAQQREAVKWDAND